MRTIPQLVTDNEESAYKKEIHVTTFALSCPLDDAIGAPEPAPPDWGSVFTPEFAPKTINYTPEHTYAYVNNHVMLLTYLHCTDMLCSYIIYCILLIYYTKLLTALPL